MRFVTKRNSKLAGLYAGVLLAAVLCSPLGIAFFIALQTAPLPPIFSGFLRVWLAFGFFAPLLWLFVAAAAPIVAVTTIVKQQHRFVPLCLLVWLISWSAWPLAKKYDRFWNWRRAGLQRITVRAKPLIRAIDAYCVREKQCPQSLDDLVPKYIAQIPMTGAAGYPQFKYNPPGDRTYSSSYELLVSTPSGGINWDVFVYWPTKKYPREMYGGVTERIGDWAYVHE